MVVSGSRRNISQLLGNATFDPEQFALDGARPRSVGAKSKRAAPRDKLKLWLRWQYNMGDLSRLCWLIKWLPPVGRIYGAIRFNAVCDVDPVMRRSKRESCVQFPSNLHPAQTIIRLWAAAIYYAPTAPDCATTYNQSEEFSTHIIDEIP